MNWLPLVALAIAQFVMVLDQSAMNVSISALVDDFDTTVTTIQAVITLYCLVMAMFMLTGGKIGDIIGRRRTFVIGLVIYACGSALTAVAPSVAVLTLGWSVLEGLGAALVLPAMVALIAGNFEGASRKVAYAVIGGVAGAGIAVGPILGGWATTEYSWRIIFAGEVLLVALILVMTPKVADSVRTGPAPKLDLVGTVLSAVGPGPGRARGAAVEHVGLGQAQGGLPGGAVRLLADGLRDRFRSGPAVGVHGWQARRESDRPRPAGAPGAAEDRLAARRPDRAVQPEPDPDGRLLHHPAVPAARDRARRPGDGPQDAARLDRHVPRLGGRVTAVRPLPDPVDRAGRAWCCRMVAAVMLLATIQPELDDSSFAWSMAVLGVGMGLLASQLGNVVQSSVDASGRGEAGGLQFTGQQLGSSLGVALLGAIVLSGLTSAFVSNISSDERISSTVSEQVGVAVGSGIDFVSADQIGSRRAGRRAGRADHPGARRRLRVRPAPGAQDRAAGSGLPGPALPGLHQGPAP